MTDQIKSATILFAAETYAKLLDEAAQSNRSVSAVVNELVRHCLGEKDGTKQSVTTRDLRQEFA